MQSLPYAPCPKCGSTNASKVTYNWWGGFLAPNLFKLVKCRVCGTEYNGRTGQSSRRNMTIYLIASLVIASCICGGASVLLAILNQQ